MSVSITCKACGKELTAETEEELAQLGMEHGAEHGHRREALTRESAMKRLRRHGRRNHEGSDDA